MGLLRGKALCALRCRPRHLSRQSINLAFRVSLQLYAPPAGQYLSVLQPERPPKFPPFKPKTSVKCRHSEERCPHLQFLKGSSTPNLHRTKPSQAHFKHQLLNPISSPPPSCQAIHTYKPLHRTNLVPQFRLRIIQKLHSSSDRTQKQHPPFHSTQVLTPQQPKTLPGDKKSWH